MDKFWEALSYQRRDLSNCESEPIQYCGAIQSCGWFLAIDYQTEEITAASSNCNSIFGVPPSKIIGQKITELILSSKQTPIYLDEAITFSKSSALAISIRGSSYVFNAHFSKCKDLVCVDIEPIVERDIFKCCG